MSSIREKQIYEKKLNTYISSYKSKLCKDGDNCQFNKTNVCYYAHSIDELRKETCLDYYYNDCSKADCHRSHDKKLPKISEVLLLNFKTNYYKSKNKLIQLEDSYHNEYKKRKREEERVDSLLDENKALDRKIKKLEEQNQRLEDEIQLMQKEFDQIKSNLLNQILSLETEIVNIRYQNYALQSNTIYPPIYPQINPFNQQ
jgi:uncharacterized protein YdcH (DUF465 family)